MVEIYWIWESIFSEDESWTSFSSEFSLTILGIDAFFFIMILGYSLAIISWIAFSIVLLIFFSLYYTLRKKGVILTLVIIFGMIDFGSLTTGLAMILEVACLNLLDWGPSIFLGLICFTLISLDFSRSWLLRSVHSSLAFCGDIFSKLRTLFWSSERL